MSKFIFISFVWMSNDSILYNGIHRKIYTQFKALSSKDMNGKLVIPKYNNNEIVLYDFENKYEIDRRKKYYILPNTLLYLLMLINYLKNESKCFIYIRHGLNFDILYLYMLKMLKQNYNKIYIEIPTYPYDREFRFLSKSFPRLCLDKIFRHAISPFVDNIVTYSMDKKIWGVKTICISNGIDFENIKLKLDLRNNKDSFDIIAVANMSFWHGYERAILGLKNYYELDKPFKNKIYIHLVGGGSDKYISKLKELVLDLQLNDYVKFYGYMSGDDLDKLFNISDFALGSLGRHRSGVYYLKSLKNREYAARGIRFIYSEIDLDFEGQPYVLKATADESPVDFEQIVNMKWYDPEYIRNSVENKLSWKLQMNVVLDSLVNNDNKGC